MKSICNKVTALGDFLILTNSVLPNVSYAMGVINFV
jgi:hypothetical protein